MLLSGVVGCYLRNVCCVLSSTLYFVVDAVVCSVLIVGAVCWCVILVCDVGV